MEVIDKQDIQVILSRLLTPCLHAVISFSPSSFILIEQKCRNSHSVSGFCDWSTGETGWGRDANCINYLFPFLITKP